MTAPLVAITGAAGVIGEVLKERLGDTYRLRLIDRRPIDDPCALRIDLRDQDVLREALEGVDAVIHLAAESSVDASWDAILESNIVGTRHLFEAARLAGVPRVVMASSNRVTGMYEREGGTGIYEGELATMLDDRAPLRPDSLYGVSKGFGELLGRYYSEAHGMRVVCLRIGTVIVPDDPLGPRPARAAAWPAGLWEQRIRATWLSNRDCEALFRCALGADVGFAIAYGVSDVPGRFWDLDGARTVLGFVPLDHFPDERNGSGGPRRG